MKQASKLLIATLFLMLYINYSYGQKEIYLSIDASNNLQITPTGTVEVGNVFSRKVSWIARDPRIVSFKIQSKPGNPHEPWGSFAIPSNGQRLDLTVGFLYRLISRTEWTYSIKAYDAEHHEYLIDPKIAIKPGTALAFMIVAVAGIVAGIFLAIQSLRRRNNLKTV